MNRKVNTNGVKSFLAVLKCDYTGIYHYFSGKYLCVYVNEFTIFYNTISVKFGKRFECLF
ncbi:transposase [Bartonella sp. AC70YNML]|uniref:transposase n=1 Tax=Bartonella sp. AC70YNML TaxID=3243460 RepID=UPI0035CF63C7